VRWFLLSDSPPERDLEWSEAGIEGAARFVQRLWRLGDGVRQGGEARTRRSIASSTERSRRRRGISNRCLQQGGRKLYELANAIEKAPPSSLEQRRSPCSSWSRRWRRTSPRNAWAAAGPKRPDRRRRLAGGDPALLVEDEVTIAVQVNGKLRDTLTAPRGRVARRLRRSRSPRTRFSGSLAGAPRKVIVVPDRLVNIVA
jgi:leucyl-tRNA synthetase